ncbi:serine/threonine-protein phosphatase 6 regulatory ankyrin repeat subunit C isoform X7 [Hydra vulgaris]|uniref:Serine/threonine-protein phosphatase 6 regulatory ankyrin repeat subunit C isoform X7 n=1 Tax=Hydra vulgaris TaxID=6087 RepID=A0ABM4D258_HYDVU
MVSYAENLLVEKSENDIQDNYDDCGITPLILACRDNNEAEVDKLLKAGTNVDTIDSDGRTALFHSVTSSSLTIVKALLSAKANPFIVAGLYKRSCLHQACKRVKNAVEVVQLLLQIMGDKFKLEQDKAGFIALHLAVNTGKHDVCRVLLSTYSKEQLYAATSDYGDTAFHLAARKKDLIILKMLVEAETNINQVNIEGQTALHIAAAEGDLDSLEYLINVNALGNIKDKRNHTPLHIATEIGNMEIIEMLVEKYTMDLNQRSKDGSTLVHLAAKSGHPHILFYFIQKGVAVRTPNCEGAEALHEACKQGHVVVAQKLIECGAKIEKYTKDNYTPLHIAVRFGKYDVAQILIGAGANVNALGGPKNESSLHFAAKLTRYSEKLTELLSRSGANIDIINSDGDTPLHAAVRARNYPVIKILLEEGASVVIKNSAGETPIHLSILSMSVSGLLVLIDEMKRFMAEDDFRLYINSKNKHGETALHYCARIPPKNENQAIYNDLIKLLLDNNAESNIPTLETNETPIHYCCQNGNADILRMIFASLSVKESSKAANLTNNVGWSALLVACYYGHPSIVRILLENEARVDYFDENGKAALHLACEHGHILCVEMLMEKKAFVDAKTKIGETPVSLAAANGHSQLVEMLVKKYHASYNIQSLTKRSALHMASENGHLHSCRTLIQLGADPMMIDMNQAAPIHLAAENNHSDIVKMFLDVRPDLASFINKDGNNCAHIAAAKGSLEVIKSLIKVNSAMAYSKSKSTMRTPLHLAAIGDHIDVLQLLINQGVSLLEEDNDGSTALHLAAQYGSQNAIEAFKGRIPFNFASSKTGMSPLHVAAEYDQSGCLADLMLKIPPSVISECPVGKNPAKTEFGFTCLHLAAKNGHEVTVRLLLNSDGVVFDHRTSKKGLLPIHLAIIEGHGIVTSLLLSRSADQISAKCAIGRSALHFAAGNNQLKLVQLLIGQGAEIDDQDKKGWTPLHYAANAGCTDIVIFLVQMGANVTIEDKKGKSPITFAAKKQHLEFLEHLMICCKLNNNKSVQDFILNSRAPIYTAIQLTLMYQEESLRIKDKSQDYIEMADFCENMTYEILHVATSFKCEAILNAIDDAKQPLLDVMIDNKFKECIAHSNVQSYLSDLWKGNGMPIEGAFSILLAVICFLCPPVWFFLCLPFHRWNKMLTIKFICHIISHLYFIIILSLVIVVPWNRSYLETYLTQWEWLLFLWLLALFVNTVTDLNFNLLKILLCFISAIGISIHILAYFFENRNRENLMYARDNVLAFALFILFIQLFDYLAMHEIFGPWTVMIDNLVMDVLKFIAVLVLFVVAFTLQVCAIYKPVYGKALVYIPTETLPFNDDKHHFFAIFFNLFFAIFGLSSKPTKIEGSRLDVSPAETFALATCVFAIYLTGAIVILLNLLIAMMGNTYEKVDERSSIEWKYLRGKVIWSMTKIQSTPNPVNIVTTFLIVLKVAVTTMCCCCRINVSYFYKEMSFQEFTGMKKTVNKVNEEVDDTLIENAIPWNKAREELYIILNYRPTTLSEYYERIK